MKIFGKSLAEYIGFEKIFLILILVVGLGRLGLSLAGVPNSAAKYASLTVLLLLGLIYYSIRVHTSGYGSYKQLLPVLANGVILANLIVVTGILLAIGTGKDNIFTAPEYSGGGNGKTLAHVAGHVIVMVVGSLLLWGVGSLIMLVTKKLTKSHGPTPGTAGA